MRRYREDDDEIVPDGGSVRVPLMLRDGTMMELPMWQRDALLSMRYQMSDAEMAMHRPGYRFSADAAANRAKAKAYNDAIVEASNAWRTPADATPRARGQQPGDVCTTDGAPGHLDHRLQCVPDRRDDAAPASPPRFMSAEDAQKMRDAAYQEFCRELTSAWKGPQP